MSVHDELFAAASGLYDSQEQEVGSVRKIKQISDNLHNTLPALNQILDCPELSSALDAVLGYRHFRYLHSFIHSSGEADQGFHKDSPLPWGSRGGMRSHRPNWAMVFYYPQHTTVDMGATEILPGTQYWNVDREEDGRPEGEDRLGLEVNLPNKSDHTVQELDEILYRQAKCLDRDVEPLKLEVPKGSLVLVHFDLFHRGTRRISNQNRFMYKFWYVRTTEPDHDQPRRQVLYSISDPRRVEAVTSHAEWLGIQLQDSAQSTPAKEELEPQEADLLSQAYQWLGSDHEKLERACLSGVESKRRTGVYATVNHSSLAVEVATELVTSNRASDRQCAAFLLGDAGSEQDAFSLLLSLTRDDTLDVRLTALNAIGRYCRRNIKETQTNFEVVFDTLFQAIDEASERLTRGNLTQSVQRQCVYIAMLNIVSNWRYSDWADGHRESVIARILKRLSSEEDRYAEHTAKEVLERLNVPQSEQNELSTSPTSEHHRVGS